MKKKDLFVEPWSDYELIDSGNGKKLERFGQITLARPETQALWLPSLPEAWDRADAEFVSANGKGSWKNRNTPDEWQMSWGDARFSLRLTSFKHTGVFPEQATNWEWIAESVKKIEKPNVLNLFGYTGVASIVATQSGAAVTHVDASKQSNEWAKRNAELSGLADGSIRYLLDDALKFAEREVRRGAKYDGIILDPPAFGRGAKGEVWHIEEDLPHLLKILKNLLSDQKHAFFLLNGYAAGYASESFAQAADSFLAPKDGEYGELGVRESTGKRCVPAGIYARFRG